MDCFLLAHPVDAPTFACGRELHVLVIAITCRLVFSRLIDVEFLRKKPEVDI